MKQAFTRLAIVNRGEAAMRLVHAVRELNEEREHQLHLIALYTEPEAAGDVRAACRRGLLHRPRHVHDAGRHPARRLPRLRGPRAGAREHGAEAAWVGWGFVAEHPDFAALCERLGVVFVGPSSETMRLLGDKIRSKQIAEEAGVPVAPWSGGPVETLDEAAAHAETIGYPLMVKATAGGGGRGIRRVEKPERACGRLRARPSRGTSGLRRSDGSAGAARDARPATSRYRPSPTARATPGPSACATAACSAATRR